MTNTTTTTEQDECPEWAVKVLQKHDNPNTVGWNEYLVEGECPECGCNRLKKSVQTAGAVECLSCPACEHMVSPP